METLKEYNNEIDDFIKKNYIEKIEELEFIPDLHLNYPGRIEELTILYKKNNKIIGLINGIPIKSKINNKDFINIYVEPLIIDKEFRNNKIAIELKYEISKISMLKYNIINSIFTTSYLLNDSYINKSSLHMKENSGIRLETELFLKYHKNDECNDNLIENDNVDYFNFLNILKRIPNENTLKFIFEKEQYSYLFKNTYLRDEIFFCYEYYNPDTIEIKYFIGENIDESIINLSKKLQKNIIYHSFIGENYIKKYYFYTYNYKEKIDNFLIYNF